MNALPVEPGVVNSRVFDLEFPRRLISVYIQRAKELRLADGSNDLDDLAGFVGGIANQVIVLGAVASETCRGGKANEGITGKCVKAGI